MLRNAQQLAAITAKEERARDAALAMKEYKAEKLAVRAKTARLRALRLAREAENKQYTSTKEAAKAVCRRSFCGGSHKQPSISPPPRRSAWRYR
jgi:hypothetical protein